MTTLDDNPVDVAVVIAAGGAGVRLGPGLPKALRELAGESLLRHAVRGVVAAGCVGCVAVAAPPAAMDAVAGQLDPRDWGADVELLVVPGGAERQESVAAALAAVPDRFQIVLVHDAARALTPSALVAEVAAAVRAGADAVIPVLPVTDTIAEVAPTGEVIGNPPRSALRAVQTPQGFRRKVLESAHAAATGTTATDDAGLVGRLGVPVRTLPGSSYALKITTGQDLVLAEALLATVRPPGTGPPG